MRYDKDSTEKIGYYHARYTEDETEKFIRNFKAEELQELYTSIPRYDFSNLETDLILRELDGVCVDDMISTALTKYLTK